MTKGYDLPELNGGEGKEGLPGSVTATRQGALPQGAEPSAACCAKAAELDRIAELCGDASDPFAAWETIELWRDEAAKAPALQRKIGDADLLQAEWVKELEAHNATRALAERLWRTLRDARNQVVAFALDSLAPEAAVAAVRYIDDVLAGGSLADARDSASPRQVES